MMHCDNNKTDGVVHLSARFGIEHVHLLPKIARYFTAQEVAYVSRQRTHAACFPSPSSLPLPPLFIRIDGVHRGWRRFPPHIYDTLVVEAFP